MKKQYIYIYFLQLKEKFERLSKLQDVPKKTNDDIKATANQLKISITEVTNEERKIHDNLNKTRSEIKQIEKDISIRREKIDNIINESYSIVPKETRLCIDYIKGKNELFKKPIYAPIYQYIGVTNELHATYFQSVVGFFTQCGILCTCDDDGKIIRRYVHSKDYRKVSIFTVTNYSSKSLNIDQIKNDDVGIVASLDEYLIFPPGAEAVRELLKRESMIQNILIGDNTFDMNKFSQYLQNQSNIKRTNNTIDVRSFNSVIVLTPTFKVTFNRIRGNNISIQTETYRLNIAFRLVTPTSYNNKMMFEKQLKDLQKQYQEKIKKSQEYNNRVSELNVKKEKYKTDFNSLQHTLDDSRNKKSSLVVLEKQINDLQKSITARENKITAVTSSGTIPSLLRNLVTRVKDIFELSKKMEVTIIGELMESRVKNQILDIQESIKKETDNLNKIQTIRVNHEGKLKQAEKKMAIALV